MSWAELEAIGGRRPRSRQDGDREIDSYHGTVPSVGVNGSTPLGSSYRPYPRSGPDRPFRWAWVVSGAVLAGLAVLTVVVLLTPATFGLANAGAPDRLGYYGGPFFFFFVLLVVFFVVRVVFWTSRVGRPGRSGRFGPDRPAMIARVRYARGEITREQYEQIMQDLERRPGVP